MKDKLIALFKSSRPISWVNTAYPFAVGYLVIAHHLDWRLVVGTLYFLIPYNLLMYGINDVFDYESDIRNPRKGGIEGAKISKAMHGLIIRAAIISNVPFLAVILFWGNLSAAVVLCLLIFMVVAYSAPYLRFKERPILDSITSSIHFVGPLVYALTLADASLSYWPYVVIFFLWGMASHALGAVQDIKADREGSIASIATVLGARWTIRFVMLLYVASIVGLYILNPHFIGICLAAFLYLLNVSPYIHTTDEQSDKVHTAWRRFLLLNWVTGFVVTLYVIQYIRS